jgi:hypothetical protein
VRAPGVWLTTMAQRSQMTADDANGINVPTCLLPSNGEDPEVVSGE